MKNFKALLIWQKGWTLLSIALRWLDFPQQERFGLATQITKSGVSIPSNIAEGSSRRSEREYGRFIEISLGSSFELETQLLISQRAKLWNGELLVKMLLDVIEEQKMLTGFQNSLNM